MPESDSILTLKDIAARYGVTYRTVTKWRRAKKFPVLTIGGVVRVRESDLHKFEQEHLEK